MTAAIQHYTRVPTPIFFHYCLTSNWLPGLLVANLIFAIYNQVIYFSYRYLHTRVIRLDFIY